MDPTNVDDPIVVGDQTSDADETLVPDENVTEAAAEPAAPESGEDDLGEGDVTNPVAGEEPKIEDEKPEGEGLEVAPAETGPEPEEHSDAVEVPVRVVIGGIAQRVPEVDVTTSQEGEPEPTPEPAPAPAPDPAPQTIPAPEPAPTPEMITTQWAAKDRIWRLPELVAMRRAEFLMEPQVTDDGALTRPFKVDDCFFLLYYSPRYPALEWGGACPVRVYLVSPGAGEIRVPSGRIPFDLKTDDAGMTYISDRVFVSAYQKVARRSGGRASSTMAEAALDLARRWSRSLKAWSAPQQSQGLISRLGGANNLNSYKPNTGSGRVPATGRTGRSINLARPTFVDGRESRGLAVPPKCHKIVFSDRAFAQIYTETQARISTETGGLMLGHYHEGVWYVIETCDPGWNGVFQVAYHEGDERYENHVSSILARLYRHPLVFLGMWHRHPGSLDTFSGTDDITNWRYADICTAGGCISGLINYDPEFRMTFYYCEHTDAPSMRYTRVDVEVGDDKFAMPEMLAMASKADVDRRSWR